MDRFAWSDGIVTTDEQLVINQNGVRLYDGNHKTGFDYGKLTLTTHRLIWRDYHNQNCILSLPLSYYIKAEEEYGSFTKSPKIVIHLASANPDHPPGPVATSTNTFVKFSFSEGGHKDFCRCLLEIVACKPWEQPASISASARSFHSGIAGIEKNIQKKRQATDMNISIAFEDLSKLMDKAKDMVMLSKNISIKLKEKHGDITEDETIQLQSYLLSLGISDPVTRQTHGNGDKYYKELARQISVVMEKPLKECGGLMTLTDVYCRINRARGMELLSPEDLVNACYQMESLNLPVRLHVFESGVMVLQVLSCREEVIIEETTKMAEEKGSLSADELATLIGLSVVLSKERLLTTEKFGKLCRDETTEGLRFYPNWFLTRV